MAKLAVGDRFPTAALKDIGGATVEFPAIFAEAPATIVFFYRGYRICSTLTVSTPQRIKPRNFQYGMLTATARSVARYFAARTLRAWP